MPTYEYRREDGSTFELFQRMSDDALETCPTTGQSVKRIIGGGAGLIFKGSGFYQTDYVRKPQPDAKPKAKTGAKSEAKADAKPAAETKTNGASSKPAPKAKEE